MVAETWHDLDADRRRQNQRFRLFDQALADLA